MRDIEHPPLNALESLGGELTLARNLAEEVAEMLVTYGRPYSKVENDKVVTRMVTKRVDIDLVPGDDSAYALRLKTVSSADAKEDAPSETLMVHCLELGKLACESLAAGEDQHEVADEAFQWQSYALFISDALHWDAEILSGQNGQVLELDDLSPVFSSLQFMHRNLRHDAYIELLDDTEAKTSPVNSVMPNVPTIAGKITTLLQLDLRRQTEQN